MRHFQTMCFRAKNGKQFLSDFKKEFGTFYVIFFAIFGHLWWGNIINVLMSQYCWDKLKVAKRVMMPLDYTKTRIVVLQECKCHRKSMRGLGWTCLLTKYSTSIQLSTSFPASAIWYFQCTVFENHQKCMICFIWKTVSEATCWMYYYGLFTLQAVVERVAAKGQCLWSLFYDLELVLDMGSLYICLPNCNNVVCIDHIPALKPK